MLFSCGSSETAASAALRQRCPTAAGGLAVILACLWACCPLLARGDWDPGDPYKMHFPQLPDPNGWDVDFMAGSQNEVADDWLCTSSGPITEVHFWYSAFADGPSAIESINVNIYADVPATPGSFSQPGTLLWNRQFLTGGFTTRFYGTGNQGMATPNLGFWNLNDHVNYYQANIIDIVNPFLQEQGTIYWLGLSVNVPPAPAGTQLGWKTSLDQFQDDAVYWDGAEWQELLVNGTGPSLDMAFVVVPEPTTISLSGLGVGLLLAARRRWRARR